MFSFQQKGRNPYFFVNLLCILVSTLLNQLMKVKDSFV